MANPTAFEIGVPLGLRTVTCSVPGIAILAAETWSVTREALKNVAGPPTNPGLPGFRPRYVRTGDEVAAVHGERETGTTGRCVRGGNRRDRRS
jgi:hypothetical protein